MIIQSPHWEGALFLCCVVPRLSVGRAALCSLNGSSEPPSVLICSLAAVLRQGASGSLEQRAAYPTLHGSHAYVITAKGSQPPLVIELRPDYG